MKKGKRKTNQEIRLLCRFRAKKTARYFLILLLTLMLPRYLTNFYLISTFLVFPLALDYAIQSSKPELNRNFMRTALLKETLQEHHFVYTKYRAESITSILIILLLAFWQLVQKRSYWHGFPLWLIPFFSFALYYLADTAIYFFLRFRMKHDFQEINIH